MYEASVPVFVRYLEHLQAWLVVAQHYAAEQAWPAERVLQARLAPDMHPFAVQARIAANFAVRACAPLADVAPPHLAARGDSFADLAGYVAQALEFLQGLTAEQMARDEHRLCREQAGEAAISLPGGVFLQQFALPNFFFHLTSAYAILRSLGVKLGKADFDGFHVYAALR